jgi:hypothetical protein
LVVVGVALCAVRLLATGTAAGVRHSTHSSTRPATVSGSVRVCGGPAPGGCRIETFGDCTPTMGCVTTNRVAAIDANGRQAALQRLTHARFHMRLAPGCYTIELLGGGRRIHRRVMQRKQVAARAGHTAVVRFVFDVP